MCDRASGAANSWSGVCWWGETKLWKRTEADQKPYDGMSHESRIDELSGSSFFLDSEYLLCGKSER